MTTILNSGSNLHVSQMRQKLMADMSSRLERASEEVATGLRSDVFKDLGARASESISLRAGMERNDTYRVSNKILADRMKTTAESLGTARGTVQQFLDFAIQSRGDPMNTAGEIRDFAISTLALLTSQMNVAYQGSSLFSGVDSKANALQPWEQVNPETGLSPKQVLAGILGGGITDGADAQAKRDAVEAAFSDDPAAAPGTGYEETFYNGSPSAGQRMTAVIDEGVTIEHGVQANDQAFRDIMKGLSMLASVDPTKMPDKASYETWVGGAIDAVAKGVAGVLDIESRLGTQQRVIDQTIAAQDARVELYRSKVLNLEGVDPYEASVRVIQLQTQLEATYEISARMARLSFLNFL
jgi:flagellar hook-associated protein 3 FlgL